MIPFISGLSQNRIPAHSRSLKVLEPVWTDTLQQKCEDFHPVESSGAGESKEPGDFISTAGPDLLERILQNTSTRTTHSRRLRTEPEKF